MFKYKLDKSAEEKSVPEKEEKQATKLPAKETKSTKNTVEEKEEKKEPATPEVLRDLLEKNLKWSQIIYEQNRKINNKMFWYAFSGWVKTLLILIPLILAFWFLPPLLKDVWVQYKEIMGGLAGTSKAAGALKNTPQSSIEQILKLLPINSAQQEQMKTILK